MKNAFFLIVALLSFPIYAQETDPELAHDFNSIIGFFLPVIIAQLTVLLADAKKYMGSGIWSWPIFWSTKIQPFLITFGLAVAVYLILAFAPFAKPFVEIFTGSIGAITAFGLFGTIQTAIDGWMKPTVDPTKPEDINAVHNDDYFYKKSKRS